MFCLPGLTIGPLTSPADRPVRQLGHSMTAAPVLQICGGKAKGWRIWWQPNSPCMRPWIKVQHWAAILKLGGHSWQMEV